MLFIFILFYFWVVPGLHCCAKFSPVAMSKGYSPVAVHGLLIEVASPVAERRLSGAWASVLEALGL